MPKTIADIEDAAIVLINNKSQSGVDISLTDGTQMDYLKRMPRLINDAQREIASVYKKIPAQFIFSQYPVPNLLPNPLYCFDITPHISDDVVFQASGAQEYYFEVDYLCDVYIEEQVNGVWQDLPTPIHISVATKPEGYTAYKGFVGASNVSNQVRIRFAGSYAYHIRNVAFFGVLHASVSDIPAYQPDNVYAMPDDFFQIQPDGVVFRGNFSDGEPFTKSKPYYWLAPNKMAVSYFEQGEFTVNYFRYPATIDGNTPTTTELELDEDSQELVAYYVAGHLLLDERPDIGTTLINEYQQKAQLLASPTDTGETEILNVTGW